MTLCVVNKSLVPNGYLESFTSPYHPFTSAWLPVHACSSSNPVFVPEASVSKVSYVISRIEPRKSISRIPPRDPDLFRPSIYSSSASPSRPREILHLQSLQHHLTITTLTRNPTVAFSLRARGLHNSAYALRAAATSRVEFSCFRKHTTSTTTILPADRQIPILSIKMSDSEDDRPLVKGTHTSQSVS